MLNGRGRSQDVSSAGALTQKSEMDLAFFALWLTKKISRIRCFSGSPWCLRSLVVQIPDLNDKFLNPND